MLDIAVYLYQYEFPLETPVFVSFAFDSNYQPSSIY